MDRSHSVVLGVALGLASLTVAAAPAAVVGGATTSDVTATPTGRRATAAALERFVAAGAPIAGEAGRAWRLADGSLFVVAGGGDPVFDRAGAIVGLRVGRRHDTGGTPDRAATMAASRAAPRTATSAAPTWVDWVPAGCFARQNGPWGAWLDSCFQLKKLRNDGSTTRDWFVLDHSGTFHYAERGWLAASVGPGSSPQTWQDWAPRADSTRAACADVAVSVTAQGVPFATTHTQCETWDITKASPAVAFRSEWRCGCGTFRGDRDVDYKVAVSTAQGGGPVWTLSFGID